MSEESEDNGCLGIIFAMLVGLGAVGFVAWGIICFLLNQIHMWAAR